MWFGCAATAGELVASLSSTGRGVRGAPGAATLRPLQSRPGRAGESRPAVSPQGQARRASSWKQDLGEAPRWRAGFQSPPRFSLPLRDCRQGRRRLFGAHHAPGTALSAPLCCHAQPSLAPVGRGCRQCRFPGKDTEKVAEGCAHAATRLRGREPSPDT